MIDVYRERDFHLDRERVIVHWLHRPFSRWSTFRIDIESANSSTERRSRLGLTLTMEADFNYD